MFLLGKLLERILDILRQKSHLHKTIVVCNVQEEVDDLEMFLKREGLYVLAISNIMKKEDILDCELMWKTSKHTKHPGISIKINNDIINF